jgi:hypothetical protein
MRGMTWKVALWTAFSATTAFAEGSPVPPVTAPSAVELGLTDAAHETGSGSRHSITYTDPQTGRRMKVTYGPLGGVESMEELTSAGRLLDRRELRTDGTLHESFEPRHELVISRRVDERSDQVERTTWENGKPSTQKYWIPHRKGEEFDQCRVPEPPSGWEKLLIDLSWISTQPQTAGSTGIPLGLNFVATPSCNAYPGGGLAQLSKDLSRGLHEGLACLKNLGPARRMDAARMLAFLQPSLGTPSLIRCTDPQGPASERTDSRVGNANAIADIPGDPHYPGMEINIRGDAITGGKASATAFHEMLHWLGYKHSDGTDVTYLVSLCCAPDGALDSQRKSKKSACELLQKNPEWTSAEYQRQFASIMFYDSRNAVARNSAYYSFHAAPLLVPHPPGRHDTIGMYESLKTLMIMDRELFGMKDRIMGDSLLNLILAQAALVSLRGTASQDLMIQDFHKNILSAYPDSDPTLAPIRKFGAAYGKLINCAMEGDSLAFDSAWHYLTEAAQDACPLLNANERVQIRSAFDMAELDFIRVKPSLRKHYEQFKNPCP